MHQPRQFDLSRLSETIDGFLADDRVERSEKALLALCKRAEERLRTLAALLGEVEGYLPAARTGFSREVERKSTHDLFCRLLSDCGELLTIFQELAAEFLAVDGRLLEVQALIDRHAQLLEEIETAECESELSDDALTAVERLSLHLADERNRLAHMVRICRDFRPRVTDFAFSILPEFCLRIDQNVDFEGEGAKCAPPALSRACVDMRRVALNLSDIL